MDSFINLLYFDKVMNIIAVIGARSGSKSIPEKNIKLFCGKPLIAWTIETAKKAKFLDRVIVSTDSEKIAKIARRYGAETPFLRPSEFANDSTGIEPVLKHAVEWLKENENYKTDIVVLLHPTNPLRRANHIDEAIKLLIKKRGHSVIAVSELPANHNPYWVFEPSKKNPQMLVNAKGQDIKDIPVRRQEMPKYYTRNDILYVLRVRNLYEKKPNLYGSKQELYIMSDFYDADINTPEEWILMENKFRRFQKTNL